MSIDAVDRDLRAEFVDVETARRVAATEAIDVAVAHRDRGEKWIRGRSGEAGGEAELGQVDAEGVLNIALAVAHQAKARIEDRARINRPGKAGGSIRVASEESVGVA